MPYAKNHIRVAVPKRSGFDKSHRNSGTGLCGTLVPLLCDELIPNSRVSVRLPIAIELPPLVSNTFMNVRYKVEAFFVPSRLTCKSFESFFCDSPGDVINFNAVPATPTLDFDKVPGTVPYASIDYDFAKAVNPGTLADYLGFRPQALTSSYSWNVNLMPFIAYHLIWQEWYRNPRVTKPAFTERVMTREATSNYSAVDSPRAILCNAPYRYFHGAFSTVSSALVAANDRFNASQANVNDFLLCDGHNLFDLRQRNFGLDYFTGCRVSPQQGAASGVSFIAPVSGSTASGTISIAAIRAANSLQQFRERNNIPSTRLVDQVKARYNANLSDGVAQRPICIGSASFEVLSRGVDITSQSSQTPHADNDNFFGVSGATGAVQYGRAFANGNEFVIKDFTANEPGYLFVIGSLVPEASYAYGIRRSLCRYTNAGSITDMACSLLQNVGDQPVREEEITGGLAGTNFGYQDRFADWMFLPNETHGEMRQTGSTNLSSFVLQRALTSASLNSSFLEIPTTYLDDVFQISSVTSKLTYWYDTYIQYKVSMPLAEFSIPSLQDPAYEHGQSVSLRRNGQIF